MKVKELIAELQKYDQNEELFVAYWDKTTVEEYGTDRELKSMEWVELVYEMENGEWGFQSAAAEDLVDTANQIIEREGEGNGEL